MKTKALRLYGANDLRLEEFELPAIKKDEILAQVVSDSLCMSSYKAVIQGAVHKRVPNDVAQNPVIIGHEFCGRIIEVGEDWKKQYRAGDKFVIQPALNYKGSIDAPGYSFNYIGGCATYIIIPPQVMHAGCLLPYKADAFFYGSLSEPVSCVIGSIKEMFHVTPGIHEHNMGLKRNGSLLIVAGAGPMGLGAIDYAVHCENRPARIVVTDINQNRLDYAYRILPPDEAKADGVELVYLNTCDLDDAAGYLKGLNGGRGYDDVLAMAPVKAVAELADAALGADGCLSFFAGPTDKDFSAAVNYYNVHYNGTHIIGTVGGNSSDMLESIHMMEQGLINPAAMVTHIGGLDASLDATLTLPDIPGGKKLIYTQISLELTAIADFAQKGEKQLLFKTLAEIVGRHNGLWCTEAEEYLLDALA